MTLQQGDLALLNEPLAQELLHAAIPARLAYVWSDGTPRVVPIWFQWTGEAFEPGRVTPLPLGHRALLGLGAVHGRAVPLTDLAWLLGEPAPDGGLALLVETGGQPLAFPVEAVLGFETLPPPTFAPQELLAGAATETGAVHHLDLGALVQTVQAQLAAAL